MMVTKTFGETDTIRRMLAFLLAQKRGEPKLTWDLIKLSSRSICAKLIFSACLDIGAILRGKTAMRPNNAI